MKLFKKKRNSKINELIDRRDEVISRAAMIANRNIPQSLIDKSLPETIKWIILPHIQEEWKKFSKINDKDIRDDLGLVYKILGVKKKIEEVEKNGK